MEPPEAIDAFIQEAIDGCKEHECTRGLVNLSWKKAQLALFRGEKTSIFDYMADWVWYSAHNPCGEEGMEDYVVPLSWKAYVELYRMWGEGPEQFMEFNDHVKDQLRTLVDSSVSILYLDKTIMEIVKRHRDNL